MPFDYAVIPNGSGGHDIFGGGFNGVWRSSNRGMTWTHVALGHVVQGMASTGNGAALFAGGDPFGVHRSTDRGATWTPVNNGLTNLGITSLLSPDGTHLFAGGGGGVFLSTDNGDHWTPVGTGLTTGVFSLGAHPGLALHANRPNPFTEGTTILYALPRAMPVRLVIHDVSGRAVRTLVNGLQGAGDRRAFWDGRDERGAPVGPGMYLYRLDADGVTLTRKMAMLK